MLTASDLAGLNPEDIQSLLGNQLNVANLMSKNIQDVYSRDLEREKLKQDVQLQLTKLQTQSEWNKMDIEAKKELAKLGFDNDKALLTMKLNDPNALKELNANITLANARARQAEAGERKTGKETEILEKTGGVKPSEEQRIELYRIRLNNTLKKDRADQLYDLAKVEADLAGEYDKAENLGKINFINTISEQPEFIYQWREPGKLFGENVKGKKLSLPVIDYEGKPYQLKAKDIAETAAANGISEKEFLRKLGVLGDDFRPK